MEKSYVGTSLCYFCGKGKEVIFHRGLKEVLPREAVYNTEPCDECKKLMELGVMIIEFDEKLTTDHDNPYRTGRYSVVKDSAIDKLLKGEMKGRVLKKRVCFMTTEVYTASGLG